jgi:hypothetical protein
MDQSLIKTLISEMVESYLLENASEYKKVANYLKSAVKKYDLEDMIEDIKVESFGVSYTFDGYMTGVYLYDNGIWRNFQDVNLTDIRKGKIPSRGNTDKNYKSLIDKTVKASAMP